MDNTRFSNKLHYLIIHDLNLLILIDPDASEVASEDESEVDSSLKAFVCNIMYSCHESDSIVFSFNTFDYVSVTKPSKKEVKHSFSQ